MNLFVMMFMLFYLTSNLYLSYRFFTVFKPGGVAGALIWLGIAMCPLFLRNEVTFLPAGAADVLYLLGAYWIALLYYGLLITGACDLLAVLQRRAGLTLLQPSARAVGCAVLAALGALMLCGSYNGQSTTVTSYSVKINKPAATGKMRIALLSDLHLGRINGARLVDGAVELVNSLNADVLFILGDTVDSDIKSVYRTQPLRGLAGVKTKYGVYAIMGNHEYIGRQGGEAARHLAGQNMTMLVDKAVRLPNNVLVIGRNDYSQRNANGQPLRALLSGASDLPVIVLDHQPMRIEEARQAGADLLLCGHTHRGQIVPNNLITRALFAIDYGFEKLDGLHVVVTCGAGSWGPPVRIGSRSEVVCIDIEFAE